MSWCHCNVSFYTFKYGSQLANKGIDSFFSEDKISVVQWKVAATGHVATGDVVCPAIWKSQ